MQEQDFAILRADAWFSSIPAEGQAALVDQARTVAIRSGDRIYGVGDDPNGLWAVLSGQVRLKSVSANGVELLALILRPGTWFGELSTLDGGPRPHDAIAYEDSRLLGLSVAALDHAAIAQPDLYRHLAVLACRHQRSALDFITQTIAQPVRNRLAGALLRAAGGGNAAIHVRQEELAAMVGVSRQALSRHLKSFETGGLIALGYGKLQVLDRDRLGAIENA